MVTQTKYARRWFEWRLNESRVIRTLTIYQIHSQVGKMRRKHPECSEWRWKTVTLENGDVLVRRVK